MGQPSNGRPRLEKNITSLTLRESAVPKITLALDLMLADSLSAVERVEGASGTIVKEARSFSPRAFSPGPPMMPKIFRKSSAAIWQVNSSFPSKIGSTVGSNGSSRSRSACSLRILSWDNGLVIWSDHKRETATILKMWRGILRSNVHTSAASIQIELRSHGRSGFKGNYNWFWKKFSDIPKLCWLQIYSFYLYFHFRTSLKKSLFLFKGTRKYENFFFLKTWYLDIS